MPIKLAILTLVIAQRTSIGGQGDGGGGGGGGSGEVGLVVPPGEELVGQLQASQLQGQVELEVGVIGDVDGEGLEAAAVEELGDGVAVRGGHLGQQLGGGGHVTADDCGLVPEDGGVEGVGDGGASLV